MLQERWMVAAKRADFKGLGEKLHLDPVVVRLIRNRDVFTEKDTEMLPDGRTLAEKKIQSYISGGLSDLHDPADMKDLKKGAAVILRAIRDGKTIRIIGDYDIDGIMSTYILLTGFRKLGGKADARIPERIRDGYGLNMRLVEEAIRDGVDLLVTCDNGIAAYDQAAWARQAGLQVVITDHHEIPFTDHEPDEQGLDLQNPGAAPDQINAEQGTAGTRPEKGIIKRVPAVLDGKKVNLYRTEDGKFREYRLPPAEAVIDPHRADETYPFDGLCGAGVAMKLVWYLYDLQESDGFLPEERRTFGTARAGRAETHQADRMAAHRADRTETSGQASGLPTASDAANGKTGTQKETVQAAKEELLQYAAIATIGDIMDLQDENRILVREGLKRLHHTQNPGLQELILQNGLEPEQVDVYHIGFVIGPCLNASGRLETADVALRLFLTEDRKEAASLAADLISLNTSRKAMTEQGAAQAMEMVETTSLKKDRVLVVYLPDCHESIAGIIAGRLKEHYHRPSFVLTRNAEGVKGSGRSIEAYSMYEELCKCRDLLTKFGGHPMAAGLSLPEKNVESFRKKLNDCCTLTEQDLQPKISIDVPVPVSYLSERLISQMDLLKPFGKGNPKPLFAEKGLTVRYPRIFGKNRNVCKMQITDPAGKTMSAIYFGEGDAFLHYVSEHPVISAVYYPGIDTWQGRHELQATIVSYR